MAKQKLAKDVIEGVKEAWQKLYSNDYDTKDNAVVLNEGLDFKESSATSVELQLNENKQTNAAEICKLFCMPIDVLNGKATEETLSQFVQNCLMPPINTIESALDHDLLTEAEKAAHYYFAFDTSELTRGDFASRINAYAVALQNNIYQLDEIREMEDKPPLGFNYIRLSLADVLLDPKTGEIYTPNTNQLLEIGENFKKGVDISGEYGIMKSSPEERMNPNHDSENGRFTSGVGSNDASFISATGPNEFQKGFSKQNLADHWFGSDKAHSHADEYIGFTMEQYAERALELIQKPVSKTILGHKTKDDQIVRYDTLANDYVKGNPQKGIKTMFKPKDGQAYYERRKKKEGV